MNIIMTFIKKKITLNGNKPFHNIITNRQIAEIEDYNNIIALANHQAQNILDNANLEANTIITKANEKAQYILDKTNLECEQKSKEVESLTRNMLNEAQHQVQDILLNSEKKATQEVWNHAQNLIANLEHTHSQFYNHTHDLIKGILAAIIKKLTSNLEVQDRMQIIVHQVFAKAQEIEYATLFFNPKDFEKLPELHIPQNWKLEKDNMLSEGLCRLVGAGGEWKTSIALIEDKMLEAIDYSSENEDTNTSQKEENDNNKLTNSYHSYDEHIQKEEDYHNNTLSNEYSLDSDDKNHQEDISENNSVEYEYQESEEASQVSKENLDNEEEK